MVRPAFCNFDSFARCTCLGLLLLGCSQPGPTQRKTATYFQPPGPKVATLTEPAAAAPTIEYSSPSRAGSCDFASGQLFPSSAPWNQPVDRAPLATDSTVVTEYLHVTHTGVGRFQTDFSFVVQQASADTPLRPFAPTEDHYTPDCDVSPVPILPGGRLEGETGYECKGKGDCHLLIHVPEKCQLFEMWRANVTDNVFSGGCLVVWDTRMQYGSTGRGANCTSADASGLPITPLLFTPDDIAKGRINHAIRLVMPNSLIRRHVYVAPATHSTFPTSGPESAPPYGARFRLRGDFDTANLSSGAKVVAEALKRYGMILVDGGELSFTTTSDQESPLKWSAVGYSAKSLSSLRWLDFELLDAGPRITWNADCSRNPEGP